MLNQLDELKVDLELAKNEASHKIVAALVIEMGEMKVEKITLETQTVENTRLQKEREECDAEREFQRKECNAKQDACDAELERKQKERDAKRDAWREERDFIQRCLVPGVVLSEKAEARVI